MFGLFNRAERVPLKRPRERTVLALEVHGERIELPRPMTHQEAWGFVSRQSRHND